MRESQQKGKKVIILLIIIAVLVLIAVAAIFLRNPADRDKNETNSQTESSQLISVVLKTGEYFVNEVRNSDNELSNADCSVKLLANNKFTLYMGWGQWYEGSYEIRDEYLNCRAMILEWDGGGGPGSESADVLFQFRIIDENKLELVAAENQDPASERHSFGEGFIIGMTYSKK